jgi:hypothetical protein
MWHVGEKKMFIQNRTLGKPRRRRKDNIEMGIWNRKVWSEFILQTRVTRCGAL